METQKIKSIELKTESRKIKDFKVGDLYLTSDLQGFNVVVNKSRTFLHNHLLGVEVRRLNDLINVNGHDMTFRDEELEKERLVIIDIIPKFEKIKEYAEEQTKIDVPLRNKTRKYGWTPEEEEIVSKVYTNGVKTKNGKLYHRQIKYLQRKTGKCYSSIYNKAKELKVL